MEESHLPRRPRLQLFHFPDSGNCSLLSSHGVWVVSAEHHMPSLFLLVSLYPHLWKKSSFNGPVLIYHLFSVAAFFIRPTPIHPSEQPSITISDSGTPWAFLSHHFYMVVIVHVFLGLPWWFGVHLPMQGTRVRALVQEDPTCHGATKPVSHNY